MLFLLHNVTRYHFNKKIRRINQIHVNVSPNFSALFLIYTYIFRRGLKNMYGFIESLCRMHSAR